MNIIKLSVVSPVYGCDRCLEDLVDRTRLAFKGREIDFEFILVDDASPDGAWRRILDLCASRPWLRGLRLSRNFGQHAAIAAGLQRVSGDWVVVMDCDLQDVPEELPRLLDRALAESLDVVFAQRLKRRDVLSKRASSAAFFALLSWLTGVRQDASTANFGVYRRTVIDAINRMPEIDRSFPLLVKWSGFRVGYEPVRHAAREEGASGYSIRKLVKLATSIILGYSDKPLRLVALAGLAFAALSSVMIAITIWKWMEGEVAVAGFTSLIASIWLVGGCSMFSLGVVGLYVGQVFRNVQGRPGFIVAEVVNS